MCMDRMPETSNMPTGGRLPPFCTLPKPRGAFYTIDELWGANAGALRMGPSSSDDVKPQMYHEQVSHGPFFSLENHEEDIASISRLSKMMNDFRPPKEIGQKQKISMPFFW